MLALRDDTFCFSDELDRLNDAAEKFRLEEMDEDEYDELSEEQKQEVDMKRLQAKRIRKTEYVP